jgi:hypothetical protein
MTMAWVALIVAFVTSSLLLGTAWLLRASRKRDQRGAIIAAYVGATVIPLIGSVFVPLTGIGSRTSSEVTVLMPLIGIGFGIYLLLKKNFVDGVSSVISGILMMLFLQFLFATITCGSC